MRIATYNVHRCIGRDNRLAVGRCIEVLRELDADIVGLQEVDANHRGPESGEALLHGAESLGYRVVHGATMRRADADYGNALLVRGQLEEIRHHDLSVPGREPRGLLEARIALNGRPMRVYVTHLGLKAGERRRQVRQLASLVQREGMPTVLMGDFNEWWPLSGPLRLLRRHFGPAPARRSFPTRLPLLILDRIWVSPARALRRTAAHHTPLARLASDHLPVWADLDLAD